MKISCCAGFPESSTTEKTVSYSFDAERQIKMTFSLAVEAYQPVFDETTAIETSNRIERFAYDVELPSNRKENSGVLSSIKILDSYDGMIYPAETGIPIRWVSKSEVSDIVTIGISLVDNDTNEETLVDIIPFNTRNYVYNIPAEFGSFEQPIIVINDQDLVEDEPLIKIIPENDYILADSFIVVSEGSFKCVNGQLPITVEVVNEDGSITISDSYSLNIVNKKIDTNNPVELTGEPLKCKKDYKEKNISLKVFNPLDKSVYDKTANILII
jgi:hypothetical protein